MANQGDGWLSWYRACCYDSSLGSNPDISKKYKMGEISKEVVNTTHSSRPKIYKKKKDNYGAKITPPDL